MNDCADGSDEADCGGDECSDGEFDCGDGSCIYASWACDGYGDCADGSDELDCGSDIPEDWTCADGYYTDTWCDCGCGAYDPVCDDPNASQWSNCGAGEECVDPTSPDCQEVAGSPECDDCEFDWTAYGAECCDTAATSFGIDCATLEGTYGWDCSGCNCPLDVEGCSDGEFDCGDGQCIYGSWACDGTKTVQTVLMSLIVVLLNVQMVNLTV